jgi:cobalt-zinc-cadmium efflux system protein
MTSTHSHSKERHASQDSLVLALSITGVLFVVELIAGFMTNSLALLADAGHMLTDLAALTLSLFALKISARPATHQKTYGYLRVEILAALGNGILLVLVAVYIFYEAYHRLLTPPEVRSVPMLAVACAGLVANLVTAGLLYRTQNDNLNIRGAFLHVMGDTLGSLGAIAAGIAMLAWKWYLADPMVSIVVAVLVLYSSWQLVRESVDVLLEGTPSHLNISSILADLGSVSGVVSVHDLHVWSITSGMPSMSCHVVVRGNQDAPTVLAELSRLMREKHKIEHTTIQIEMENWDVPRIGSTPLF